MKPPKEIQPDGIGNHFDGGRDTQFQLAWSDEFNGQMLNSNKWHIRKNAQLKRFL